jgi:hypothetical protein
MHDAGLRIEADQAVLNSKFDDAGRHPCRSAPLHRHQHMAGSDIQARRPR